MEKQLPSDLLPKKLDSVDEMISTLLHSTIINVLDIETTGFSPEKGAEIIEIAAIKIDIKKKKIVKTFNTLVKPVKAKIGPKITSITNITNEMVENAPFIEDVLDSFHTFLGEEPVLMHNAKFDWITFLQNIMQIRGKIALNKVICSLIISKYLHPSEKKHNLSSVCSYYGVEMKDSHRALIDAKYTASVCLRFYDELCNSLIHYNPIQNTQQSLTQKKLPVRIMTIKCYKYKTKRMGNAVFFTTNLGSIYFNTTRSCWGFQKLTVPFNVCMSDTISQILTITNSKEEELWDKYLH